MKVQIEKLPGVAPKVLLEANEYLYSEENVEVRIKMLRLAKAWLKKQGGKK